MYTNYQQSEALSPVTPPTMLKAKNGNGVFLHFHRKRRVLTSFLLYTVYSVELIITKIYNVLYQLGEKL